MLEIEICNRQSLLDIPHSRWRTMIRELIHEEGYHHGEISIAVVDDNEMHELNRTHLDHDYPTDVLSFVLERQVDCLCGEVIVSSETAYARSRDYGWSAEDELLLYVIHGVLHLVGYDDKQPQDIREMRSREAHWLNRFDLPIQIAVDSDCSKQEGASQR